MLVSEVMTSPAITVLDSATGNPMANFQAPTVVPAILSGGSYVPVPDFTGVPDYYIITIALTLPAAALGNHAYDLSFVGTTTTTPTNPGNPATPPIATDGGTTGPNNGGTGIDLSDGSGSLAPASRARTSRSRWTIRARSLLWVSALCPATLAADSSSM